MPPLASSPDASHLQLADRIRRERTENCPLIVALTGSVACGKTTLAAQLLDELSGTLTVETISTDGFLYPNAVLEERSLMMRKGFPESYHSAAMAAAIARIRLLPTEFPAHSHETYDIDPALSRTVGPPDILVLEGLGFTPPSSGDRCSGEPDLFVYLDARTEHIETWFLDRFMRFWHAAADDPASFYRRFRGMSETEAREFARTEVWQKINLPNLENHILPLRDHADIVVMKDEGHRLSL
ncbi:type I pantothenate kinase [Henriciella marina]|uniref:type I pantothenate kinase n=1 Tax=Henriciella marina TaxID=453851 RepID=UPI0003A736EA|nr:type I pantothenate kinase [Henriciella marina]